MKPNPSSGKTRTAPANVDFKNFKDLATKLMRLPKDKVEQVKKDSPKPETKKRK
jgi:hypothetical protein